MGADLGCGVIVTAEAEASDAEIGGEVYERGLGGGEACVEVTQEGLVGLG